MQESHASHSSASVSFHLPSSLLLSSNPNDDHVSEEDIVSQPFQACQTLQNLEASSSSLSRKERLLSRESIKKTRRLYCCSKHCLRQLGFHKIMQERTTFFKMRRHQQNLFLRASLRVLLTTQYTIGDTLVCRKCFLKVFALSNQRMKKILSRPRFEEEATNYLFTARESPQGSFLKNWLERFFAYNGERLPNSKFTHLPDNFTKAEVYGLYQEALKERNMPTLSMCSFLRVWRQDFADVKIPKKTRMGVCQICAQLKARRDNAKTVQEKALIQGALKVHREQQSIERQKLAKHRKKCLEQKEKYLGLVIDGMDQKKTMIPHFIRSPKNLKEENFVQLHVVGALIFNGVLSSKVFINFPNIHNYPNLTITIIQTILNAWQGPLPKTLYVQLDNTARENKNQVLLAYLNMLVEQKIFRKIKLGFLLVGHTHDQIDQMFSRFSVRLAKKSAFDLIEVCNILKEAYVPQPEVQLIKGTYDFRKFAIGRDSKDCAFVHLNDHSFQHQFKIEQKEGETRMWCKKYSNSEAWHPSEGLKFLICMPQCQVSQAQFMLLSSSMEPLKAQKESRSINYHQCLAEIKETILAAHVYFPACSFDWWDKFFEEQERRIQILENNSGEILIDPFSWPDPYASMEDPQSLPTSNSLGLFSQELELLVHGETREAYLGARKSTLRRQQEKEMWEGNVNELSVGTMIAVLATDDENEYPFWLAKIIKVEEENQVVHSVDVHWYKAIGQDALTGRYYPEMLQAGKKGKKSRGGQRRIDKLILEDVEVLVYGFSLKKSGHLRQTTIKILLEKVGGLAQETQGV